MSLTNNPFWFSSGATAAGGGGGFYPYSIDQSIRCNRPDSAYVYRSPSSNGNRQTFTLSAWVKRADVSSGAFIFGAGTSGSQYMFLGFNNDGRLVTEEATGGQVWLKRSTNLYRDVSAWYHVVMAVDTTDGTASNRIKLWVNNERITSFTSNTDPSQNTGTYWNGTTRHDVGGASAGNSSLRFDGFIAEVHNIDGTALDPTSFGESKNGAWIPKRYDTADGAYGTNGFYLKFADNSTATALGTDSSGQGNNFSVTNFSTTDQMPDSPTNNFATMNALQLEDVTLEDGNLLVRANGGTGTAGSTVSVSSGKWYFEARNDGAGAANFERMVGIMTSDAVVSTTSYSDVNKYVWWAQTGNLRNNSNPSYGDTWTADGDIIGIALDLDNGAMWFSKNGTWQASATQSEIEAGTTTNAAFTGLTGEYNFIISSGDTAGGSTNPLMQANFGQDSTFGGNISAGGNADDSGLGDFAYTVPSGFNCLALANLPEPTIGPNSDTASDDYFNTVLYTGDSDNDVTVTNTFAADWVWLKIRETSGSTTQHFLQDIVRGFGGSKSLSSSSTGQEGYTGSTQASQNIVTTSSSLRLVSADFVENSKTYVAWTWKAGGTAVSNTSGSITSSVSANQDAGFSIVTYASTTGTVGHGLTQAPEAIIMKATNVSDQWTVGHKDLNGGSSPWNYGIPLNSSASIQTNSGFWNNTAPTSTVFSQGSWDSGYNKVAYCFHSVEGFSKVGNYVGNASSDGPFVYTGFRPAFVLLKVSSASNYWFTYDNKREGYNQENDTLSPNVTDPEDNSYKLDLVSNGFKIRGSNNAHNQSGQTFIYLAFAENPFKYANAR